MNNQTTKHKTDDELRSAVRQQYAEVATKAPASACSPGCCGAGASIDETTRATLNLGYSADDLAAVPEGANMGLGCGNPQAIAMLRSGETVLDLGAGGGFDCFLAAKQVGPSGRVIGVDMTPEMVAKARANAEKIHAENVEFRLGEIERLPVADGVVDAILSNCVINLSPDKAAVFGEAFRVLRPGGRLAISDVLATREIPDALRNDVKAYAGCIAGAASVAATEQLLREAGFEDVRVQINEKSRALIRDWMPGSGIETYVASATVEAVKPDPAARKALGGEEKAASCCAPTCCSPKADT